LQLNVPAVHKNSPAVNDLLKSVKHLVKIVPVSFPYGMPKSESDFQHSVLHSDGRLEVKQSLLPLEKCLASGESEEKKVWEMDEATVEKGCRRVMELFNLSREYFPAKYVYKYNEDGKEFRYHGDENVGTKDRQDWY
jgi:large subunit ribosomal protein L30